MKDLWRKFRSGLFTKTQFITGVTISLITTSAMVYAFTHLSLNIFSSGDPISAAQVNANFEYLNERLKYIAGNQFAVKTDYDISSLNVLSSTTVPVDFTNVLVDFTDNGIAQDLVDFDLFTVAKTGQYSISYEFAAAPVIGTGWANGSVFVEINPLGTGTFNYQCCGGDFNFFIPSSAGHIPTSGGGMKSFAAGDIVRFRIGIMGWNEDIDISLLKIKIKEN